MAIPDLKLRYVGSQVIRKPSGGEQRDWVSMVCGHCGSNVSAFVVAVDETDSFANQAWVQCPICLKGSVVFGGHTKVSPKDLVVVPGHRSQPDIAGLPSPVKDAYDEARDCFAAVAYTGCELLCRKLIMYVAVDKVGAPGGESFAKYLGALESSGYLTPAMKPWVDRIRQHGNAATHELDVPTKDRAEGTLEFTALLLRLIYETEHKTAQFVARANDSGTPE